MVSLKIFVLCCVVLLAIIFEEGESWGKFTLKHYILQIVSEYLNRLETPLT